LSLQYHLPIGETLKPYVGVGVNWTMFSNEDVDVPVDVSIDDSVGLALQTGVDIQLGDEIEGDVEVEGVDVGSVEVNPLVFGLNLGYRI
jgi:outer membrane protein